MVGEKNRERENRKDWRTTKEERGDKEEEEGESRERRETGIRGKGK